jgi:hypothetical protein
MKLFPADAVTLRGVANGSTVGRVSDVDPADVGCVAGRVTLGVVCCGDIVDIGVVGEGVDCFSGKNKDHCYRTINDLNY